MKIFRKYKDPILENFMNLLFGSFFVASFLNLIINKEKFNNLSFVDESNIFIFLLVMFIAFVLTIFIGKISKLQFRASLLLLISIVCFSLTLIIKFPDNLIFTVGIIFMNAIAFYYVLKDDKILLNKIKISDKALITLIVIGFVISVYVVIKYTVIRYQIFSATTYDFGIFSQMFEYLVKTGIPYTTLERDGLLTHFAVHFSPIFYLLLPGYYLFRSPIYLLVVQAISIFLGVVPIYLLCKNKKLDNFYILLICFIYLLYPAFTAGAFWEFHENKLLTVLLLWMIYFLEKEEDLLMYIFMFLVLLVKEDAALYIIFIGMYKIFYNKKMKPGVYILIIGMLYFLFSTSVIYLLGGEVMTDRFENYFTVGASGLLGTFKTIFFDFGFLIKEIMLSKKTKFLIWMFLPLMFLPFFNRKISNLILLIPLMCINLMPDYPYQYDVNFQYTYGVAALLFYSMIMNIQDSKEDFKRIMLVLALVSSLYLYFSLNYSKFMTYHNITNKEDYVKTAECLDAIPFDSTIAASTFFTSYLSNREIIYMYPSVHQTEYIILSIADDDIEKEEEEIFLLGYENISICGGAAIYRQINR